MRLFKIVALGLTLGSCAIQPPKYVVITTPGQIDVWTCEHFIMEDGVLHITDTINPR